MIQNHIHKRPNVCCVWFYSSALPSSSSSFFLFPIFECRPNLYLSNTIEKRSGKNQFLFSLRVHPSLLLLSIILFFSLICLFRRFEFVRVFKRITHKLIVDGIRYSNMRTFMQTYLISESSAQMEQMNGSVVCNFSWARFLYEPESCNQTHTRADCSAFIYGYTVAHTNMKNWWAAFCCGCRAFWCCYMYSTRKRSVGYYIKFERTSDYIRQNLFSLEMRYTGIDVWVATTNSDDDAADATIEERSKTK